MGAFTNHILASSQFERPVAKFIQATIEKEPDKVDSVGRESDLFLPSPSTFLFMSESSVDVKMRKRSMDNQKITDELSKENRISRRRSRKLSSLSSSSLNFLPLPADFSIDFITKHNITKAQKCEKTRR